mmetsp:Transcript_5934/g.21685  ORF Transcript_5934/g.21685 Transcript_5934/m.21685 type:complete len:360 (+) Transcript_5934:60-1139(+)
MAEQVADIDPQWEGAGSKEGVEVWRVENKKAEGGKAAVFGVKKMPQSEHGKFYSGDSYIVLKTSGGKGSKFKWDAFFWVGKESSQDEYAVAAYKIAELDDFLDGLPVQHRETQGHESDLFMSCFPSGVHYLNGGVKSGFGDSSEKKEEHKPRLFQAKKSGRSVRHYEVPLARESLNHGDAFVLDAGDNVYTWFGDNCSPFEKAKATEIASGVVDSRAGKSAKKHEVDDLFWQLLGGEGDIADAFGDGEHPLDITIVEKTETTIYHVWEDEHEGEVKTKEVEATKDSLVDNDAFIVDIGHTLFVWVGSGASKKESSAALIIAENVRLQQGKPPEVRVVRVLAGQEEETGFWAECFAIESA